MEEKQTTLGELISLFYAEYLEQYGDEEIANVATAATINEILSRAQTREDSTDFVDLYAE